LPSGDLPINISWTSHEVTKPRIEDFLPLVQRIERRLTATSNFLTQAGRLEMVNSLLFALPTFFMGKIKLPPTVIKQMVNTGSITCGESQI
jgi:hypothetical protein